LVFAGRTWETNKNIWSLVAKAGGFVGLLDLQIQSVPLSSHSPLPRSAALPKNLEHLLPLNHPITNLEHNLKIISIAFVLNYSSPAFFELESEMYHNGRNAY